MASHTDELLLHYKQPEETVEQHRAAPNELAYAKEALRLFEDLKQHKGYQLLIAAIADEARHCLTAMDKSDNPTHFTKYASNYYSLTHVVNYVDGEMSRLRALLQLGR